MSAILPVYFPPSQAQKAIHVQIIKLYLIYFSGQDNSYKNSVEISLHSISEKITQSSQ